MNSHSRLGLRVGFLVPLHVCYLNLRRLYRVVEYGRLVTYRGEKAVRAARHVFTIKSKSWFYCRLLRSPSREVAIVRELQASNANRLPLQPFSCHLYNQP